MKKILLTWNLVLIMISALAQEEEPIVQNPDARSRIEAARAAYITERLALTTTEAEKFWPIYREFAQKRQALRQQYRQARQSNLVKNELINLQHQLRQQELDLEKDYSDKFLKVIPAEKLVNLRNAEKEFTQIVIKQLQQRQQRRQQRDNENPPRTQPHN